MIKLPVLALIITSLVGCSIYTADEVRIAAELCKSNEGLSYLKSGFFIKTKVTCKNKATFIFKMNIKEIKK